MIRLIVVRHGQTVKNKQGLAQGHTDSGLTEEGLVQAQKVSNFLKDVNVDAVFSSSLGRAVQTAEIIAQPHNLKLIVSDDLKEINWGDFTKYSAAELVKEWSQYYESEKAKGVPREQIRPPNGENAFDHVKYIGHVLDEILAHYKNRTVVIVGHSGTNKVLIGMLQKMDPEQFYNIKQNNACINFLDLDDNGYLINAEINVTKHLD